MAAPSTLRPMSGSFAGYWRDRKRLVMDRNAVLPDRCVKCNEPAFGYRKKVNLSHSPLALLVIFGELAHIVAKRATVEIALCEQHRRGRSRAINGVLFTIASFVTGIYLLLQPAFTPMLGLALLLGGFGGVIYAVVVARTVQAAKITDTHLWLSGCGAAFLDSLPLPPATTDPRELPTIAPPAAAPRDAVAEERSAFASARNGALGFTAACAVTAVAYAIQPGELLWGLMFFGALGLFRGISAYRRIPAASRLRPHLVALAAIVAVGLASGAYLAASEVQAAQERSLIASFDAALGAAEPSHTAGATLFSQVMGRPGRWTAQDSVDMTKVATLYAQVADAIAATTPPSSLAWYRDALVKNYRDAADIANGYAKLNDSTPQSAFDALNERWTARVSAYAVVQARLRAQQGLPATPTATARPSPTQTATGVGPKATTGSTTTAIVPQPVVPGTAEAHILIKTTPNTTVSCTILTADGQTQTLSPVQINGAGLGGCGLDLNRSLSTYRGQAVTFIVKRSDGSELGRATVVMAP